MRPFVNLFLIAGCLLASLCVEAAVAEPARRIDVKRLSKNIDDVVVPLPNEIFGALCVPGVALCIRNPRAIVRARSLRYCAPSMTTMFDFDAF